MEQHAQTRELLGKEMVESFVDSADNFVFDCDGVITIAEKNEKQNKQTNSIDFFAKTIGSLEKPRYYRRCRQSD
jgi:hypothetical protein